jgi:YebC/PmpR family DNA-binding regulatory protein
MGRMFEKRKTTIFARARRVSKQFSRCAKDIAIAVKAGGPSPEANATLRRVIQNARALNMPKDKIESAIRRASGVDAVDYEEIVYEGYAPHGIALLIEAATDNPTRTVANVRSAFKAHGGNLGTAGSVGYLFQRMAVFRLPAEGLDADELELDLIDHGLEEMLEGEGDDGEPQLVIRCAFSDLGNMQRALEERGIETAVARSEYVCQTPTGLPDEQGAAVLALVDALEQDDDVHHVYHSLA